MTEQANHTRHTWLITGAASGIGAAMVKAVAATESPVIAADVADDSGRAIAEEAGASYRRCDVSSLESWTQLADYLQSEDNTAGIPTRIHLNAGVQLAPPDAPLSEFSFDAMTEANYRRLMGVNVDGVAFGLHTLLPMLTPGSSIVVTASLAGITPYAIDPLYAMSKHAVVGLVRSLAPTLSKRGINIHAICPGGIDTPLVPEAQRSADVPFMTPEHIAEEVMRLIEEKESGKTWAKVSESKPIFIIRAPGDKP